MEIKFNAFGQYEIPTFVLCNPDTSRLYVLGDIYDRSMVLRFNALSELSFTAKSKTTIISSGTEVEIDTPYFSYLEYLRLIFVENVGYFMITGKEETNDGVSDILKITAQSIEVDLNFKRLGVYKRDSIRIDTLMNEIMMYIPDWTLEYLNPDISTLYRSFDVVDKTVYSFLTENLATTLQCIFSFDIYNRKLSVLSVAEATEQTDVVLSFDNLVENITIKSLTEELVTALNVYGGNGLEIRYSNPLGTSTIYNFTHYKDLKWMSGGLKNKITAWENLVVEQEPQYKVLSTQLMDAYDYLATQETLLKEAQINLAAKETLLVPYINNPGLIASSSVERNKYYSILGDINTLKDYISQYTVTIKGINDNIGDINSPSSLSILGKMKAINKSLSFDEWNDNTLEKELSHFIRGNTFTNENLIKTDGMTSASVVYYGDELYKQGKAVLAKVSEPRLEFTLDATNFVLLKDYSYFTSMINMNRGSRMTVEIAKGLFTTIFLLELTIDFENPNNFKMVFGNRLRLDDKAFQFSDLFNQSVNSGLSTAFNSIKWSNFGDNYQTDVSNLINNALDASRNAVVSSTNQEITFDTNGLKARQSLSNPEPGNPARVFSKEQIWMTNNTIAFTDDNWNTVKTAVGRIVMNGQNLYGIAGQAIFGNIIAGNTLTIGNNISPDPYTESTRPGVLIDGSGISIKNGRIFIGLPGVSPDYKKSSISIDTNGIKFLTNLTNTYEEKTDTTSLFSLDIHGNLKIAGDITGSSGTFSGSIVSSWGKIGGWTIKPEGLSNTHDYINANGNVSLGNGALKIFNPGKAGAILEFHGNIYADKITGDIVDTQISNLDARKVISGTILNGVDITWGGSVNGIHPVKMYANPKTLNAYILASTNLELRASGISTNSHIPAFSALSLNPERGIIISTNGTGPIRIGALTSRVVEDIRLYGRLITRDPNQNIGLGVTTEVTIPATLLEAERTLTFVNGLLVTKVTAGAVGDGGTVPPLTPPLTPPDDGGGTILPEPLLKKLVFDFTDSEEGWIGYGTQHSINTNGSISWEPGYIRMMPESGYTTMKAQWYYHDDYAKYRIDNRVKLSITYNYSTPPGIEVGTGDGKGKVDVYLLCSKTLESGVVISTPLIINNLTTPFAFNGERTETFFVSPSLNYTEGMLVAIVIEATTDGTYYPTMDIKITNVTLENVRDNTSSTVQDLVYDFTNDAQGFIAEPGSDDIGYASYEPGYLKMAPVYDDIRHTFRDLYAGWTKDLQVGKYKYTRDSVTSFTYSFINIPPGSYPSGSLNAFSSINFYSFQYPFFANTRIDGHVFVGLCAPFNGELIAEAPFYYPQYAAGEAYSGFLDRIYIFPDIGTTDMDTPNVEIRIMSLRISNVVAIET